MSTTLKFSTLLSLWVSAGAPAGAVGKGSPTPDCRITVDNTVVAEKPPGGDSHCIWTR